MSTLFTKIINGEIPSYKIYEDEYTYAFLDIYPLQYGQLLVVPKTEVDHFEDLEEPYYGALFTIAKKLATPLKQITGAKRIGVVIEGLEVPHVHIKLIPINTGGDLDSTNTYQIDQAGLAALQKKLTLAI